MIGFVARRVAIGFLVLLAMSVVVFAGTELLPGDVTQAILGQYSTPEAVAVIRSTLGLDRPAPERYVEWLHRILTGELGRSLATDRELGPIVALRLKYTALLAIVTACVAVPLSVSLGVISAMRVGKALDRTITIGALALISAPEFMVAALLVGLFAAKLHWAPAVSYISPDMSVGQLAEALVLPVMTLTAAILAPIARMTRATILEVLKAPAIEMALLKGVPRRRIILRHAVPNALSPIINVVVLNLAYLVSGVVVVETIFSYPGLAKLMVDAVASHDVPLVQVCAVIFCGTYVLLNMIADVLAIIFNPRLRQSSR